MQNISSICGPVNALLLVVIHVCSHQLLLGQMLRVVACNKTYQANDPSCCTCIIHILLVHRCQCWKVECDGGEEKECKPDEIYRYADSYMARKMREDEHER